MNPVRAREASMPLTRHLYREDEVVAALVFCCVRGRHVEAAFWCLELLDSGLVDELLEAMRRAWLYGIGIRGLGWLKAFQTAAEGDAIDPELMLQLVQGLCRSAKDRSVMTLLGAEITGQPDRVNAGETAEAQPLDRFVALAILQRRTMTAWAAVRAMEDPEPLLRRIGRMKHGVEIGVEAFTPWEQRAILVAAFSLGRAEFKASSDVRLQPLVVEVAQGLQEWRKLAGRRRRVFSIPPECLYYFTERGRALSVYDTTEKEIMGRLEKPGALWGSGYWDEVAGDWGAIRSDDAAREAFYDEHFPDDRPDEWSKVDRAKSHGAGPLQRGAAAIPERAFHTLLGRLPSAVIWGPLPPVKNWETLEPVSTTGWNLSPVTRRLIDPSP